jgi:hypothetical protein
MSDASSNAEQTNDEVPKNLLAKKFFDKLRKDGPKLDKVGQSFVRHFSQPAANHLNQQPSQDLTELTDDTEEALSPARRFRQLRIEIIQLRKELMKDLTDRPKDSDSHPGNEADKK